MSGDGGTGEEARSLKARALEELRAFWVIALELPGRFQAVNATPATKGHHPIRRLGVLPNGSRLGAFASSDVC
jgi:hypothetical protein